MEADAKVPDSLASDNNNDVRANGSTSEPPRPLEEAARAKGVPLDVALAAAQRGDLALFVLRNLVAGLAWGTHQTWRHPTDQERTTTKLRMWNLPFGRRTPDFDFARIGGLSRNEDLRILITKGATVNADLFVVPISATAIDETTPDIVLEGWILEANSSELHGMAASGLPVSLTDLWALPSEVAKLAESNDLATDADGAASRMPRHEEDLKRCIGALARLLAEHAPSPLRFASSRKTLPYNATKIAEAVQRETGLNPKNVAKWLGEAKDLPPKDEDE